MALVLIIAGMFMLGIGLYLINKIIQLRELEEFNIDQTSINYPVKFPASGYYSINLIGAFEVRDSGVDLYLISKKGKLKMKENFLKYRFKRQGRFGLEMYTFFIDRPGKFTLNFDHLDRFIIKPPHLYLKVMEAGLNYSNLSILIKETLPIYQKIFSIVLTVIGLLSALIGLFFLIGF